MEMLTQTALSVTPAEREISYREAEAEENGKNCDPEAERAVLGAVINKNDCFDDIASVVKPEHFSDSLHQEIFRQIGLIVAKGRAASPVSLRPSVETHYSLSSPHEAVRYLTHLSACGVSPYLAKDYAKIIFDLATLRSLANVGGQILKAASAPGEQSPAELILEAEQSLFSVSKQGANERGLIQFGEAAKDAVKVAESAFRSDNSISGISTQLIDLDEKLGGLQNSDLIILAGRPSMGKTALATNLAYKIAAAQADWLKSPRKKKSAAAAVAFFSLEMSAQQLAARILSDESSVPAERLRRGNFDEEAFERLYRAAQDLENIPLFIDDTPALPLSSLASRCRRMKRQNDLGLIIVDYLQLLRPPIGGRRTDNRVLELTEISMGLKALAKELDVPVLALSQLSRAVESRDDKRPMLSDLRESGSIEQDADIVMFVYREEYYLSRSEPKIGTPTHDSWLQNMNAARNVAEVIIAKQRHGPIGTVKLHFNAQFTRFGNLTEETAPAPSDTVLAPESAG